MASLFALIILAAIVIGLLRQRRQRRDWVREEQVEESGGWIDKRAGERGTYGSLDAERERERQGLSRQGRVTELVQLVRAFAFEAVPGFHERPDSAVKAYNAFARKECGDIISALEAIRNGAGIPAPAETTAADPTQVAALKKQLLDFTYRHYPALLELDLDAIRQLDRLTEFWAGRFVEGQ